MNNSRSFPVELVNLCIGSDTSNIRVRFDHKALQSWGRCHKRRGFSEAFTEDGEIHFAFKEL